MWERESSHAASERLRRRRRSVPHRPLFTSVTPEREKIINVFSRKHHVSSLTRLPLPSYIGDPDEEAAARPSSAFFHPPSRLGWGRPSLWLRQSDASQQARSHSIGQEQVRSCPTCTLCARCHAGARRSIFLSPPRLLSRNVGTAEGAVILLTSRMRAGTPAHTKHLRRHRLHLRHVSSCRKTSLSESCGTSPPWRSSQVSVCALARRRTRVKINDPEPQAHLRNHRALSSHL